MHSVTDGRTDRQTDRQTDGQQAYANSRSYCVAVRSAKNHVFVCVCVAAQVKGMGMDSPELLLLVENCPRGAETLVTRIIHILTDKGMIQLFVQDSYLYCMLRKLLVELRLSC